MPPHLFTRALFTLHLCPLRPRWIHTLTRAVCVLVLTCCTRWALEAVPFGLWSSEAGRAVGSVRLVGLLAHRGGRGGAEMHCWWVG